MKTPQQPRGRGRRRGKAGEIDQGVSTQALAAAIEGRLGGKGKRGAAPGGLATAAAGDRLAANRYRASRVRTGDT